MLEKKNCQFEIFRLPDKFQANYLGLRKFMSAQKFGNKNLGILEKS